MGPGSCRSAMPSAARLAFDTCGDARKRRTSGRITATYAARASWGPTSPARGDFVQIADRVGAPRILYKWSCR